jgi:alkylhydroperoxidase/carboxymuconolactone decarboxylase family protein YurZ
MDSDRLARPFERGKGILEAITKRPEPLNAVPKIINVFLKEPLFTSIFERDILSYIDRELTVISALTATDGMEPMRQEHIRIGMNLGITEAQL